MTPGNYLRALASSAPSESQQGLLAGADFMDAETADADVDVKQKGSGFSPVLGLSIKPNDRFNLGIKYEFNTKLELENETKVDGTGRFPDGEKIRSDLPALLSVGVAFKATDRLNLAGGVHYFFDKAADYGRIEPNEELIDNNFLEFAFGIEYNVTPELLLSVGYLRTQTGVNEKYQNDLNYSLNTNTVGLGGSYAISQNLDLNLGFLYTMYEDDGIFIDYPGIGSVKESYARNNMVIAIGLDIKFPVR
jgi:long-subunit fatty acid transport protein